MRQPRFKVGDLVRVHAVCGLSTAQAFIDAIGRNSVVGIYEVAAVLSRVGILPQYRVRRGGPSQERVVRESQLVPVNHQSSPANDEC